MPARPPIRHALAVAVAGLLTLPATGLLAGCEKAVVVPPADAPPQDVVRAYLDAVARGRCGDLAEIATRNQAESGWCGRGLTISDVSIGEPRDDAYFVPGAEFEQTVFVPVHLTVMGGHGSIAPGARDWGYVLVRDSPVQRWRVAGEGTFDDVTHTF